MSSEQRIDSPHCPDWCDVDHAQELAEQMHPSLDDTDGTLWHRQRLHNDDDFCVEVSAFTDETGTTSDGPSIFVTANCDIDQPSELRLLAAALLNAADTLDELNR